MVVLLLFLPIIELIFSCARVDLAGYFGENDLLWSLTWLLHDLNNEKTESCPEKQPLFSEEILKDFNVPEMVAKTIKIHNFHYFSYLTRVVWKKL